MTTELELQSGEQPEEENNFSECSLDQLCDYVVTCTYPFDDLAEQIEDKAYEQCTVSDFDETVGHLRKLTDFFEQLESKNEEICRDLSDIYLLIGDITLCVGRVDESIEWFEKGLVVDDQYDVAFHSLGGAFLKKGEKREAVRCFEQEIVIAPGNYYTYLLLADLYEELEEYEEFARVLEHLLERDPSNVRALHKLITHYEEKCPALNISYLRRRLTNVDRDLLKRELVIWTYHMCQVNRHQEAMLYLMRRQEETPEMSIVHVLSAHVYGELKQFTKKRYELSEFKRLCHGDYELMGTKLNEFRSVFGDDAYSRLTARLAVSNPTKRFR